MSTITDVVVTESGPVTASNRATVNTPPRLHEFDVIGDDVALVEAMAAFGAADRVAECAVLGRALGSTEGLEAGFAANEHPPVHRPYDRSGVRTDEVWFDPAWHHVMRLAVEHGVAGSVWADRGSGAQVARAAKFIGVAQVEAGATCPLAMTYSCVPALRLTPDVAARWESLVTSGVYDPRSLPPARKRGALIGMALTEKQGGSDVRANTTIAVPDEDGWYRVSGEKWFVSAVHSDAMFVLAQTAEGVSCLLVPRRIDDGSEDGSDNGWTLDRLKDKLGNRSNPTAEVRFDASLAQLVGEPGRGVRAIMAMIGGTRQDCVLGSTAVMRTGTIEAIHWASHRLAFGRRLAEQPAMTSVLADLALETESATWAAMRLARATEDAAGGDARAAAFRRLAAPVLKFWICKRAPQHAAEALECQGGYGYIEESRLPRSYREAPLMSIWEGSGNVQALDVLRALRTEPDALAAFLDELDLANGANRRLDTAVRQLRDIVMAGVDEARARDLTGRMARCLQASLLVRFAPSAVADAYCAAKLEDSGGVLGCLPTGIDTGAIVARHRISR